MNPREQALAILNYLPSQGLPLVHFGFWDETLQKWADEGHISQDLARNWRDGNEADYEITRLLGFDFNWSHLFYWNADLEPNFERRVLRVREDGTREVVNRDGVTVIERDEAGSIPAEVEHLLKNRAAWEAHYLPRLGWDDLRVDREALGQIQPPEERTQPLGIWCGSLLGRIREWTGVVGLSYLIADDPGLVDDMIATCADLFLHGLETILRSAPRFDFAHFWEDICYKNGPLVNPRFFAQKVGPHYRRITDLLRKYGVELISVDCDGKIDRLIPIWLENGVNVMFPMEVGTWRANLAPWRAAYGPALRGVGGMDKVVFAHGRDAVDLEIERLKPQVALGGYLPCPDHRIAPDAEWDCVRYYCDRMRSVFG